MKYTLEVKYKSSAYTQKELTRTNLEAEVSEYLNTLSHRIEFLTITPVAEDE